MNVGDETAIRQGVRFMLNRREVALNKLIGHVIKAGFTQEKSQKIVDFWLKHKLVKYKGDHYSVGHGGYWEKEALDRAYEFAMAEKSKKNKRA